MSSPQPPPPPDSQAAQAGLAILVGLAIAKLWPSLDFLHLRQWLPACKAATARPTVLRAGGVTWRLPLPLPCRGRPHGLRAAGAGPGVGAAVRRGNSRRVRLEARAVGVASRI